MSDMVPEVLNAALDSLFTPKEPGELEYQGDDGLLYCRNCHTPVQCRVKLWGRDKIVPCLCRCQQEAMAEKKRQDELLERQRKIRQLKATGIQEKHLLEWNFGVAEDNKDIQMAKRYVEQWKKVKAENLGLLLLYRKDRLRRSFELKMPAGRRATQIDDLGIKKDKNLPHQILHQDRHHLENNPYPAGLPRSYGECPWK